jgi:hypothetical protein
MWTLTFGHHERLCRDARGGYGGIRQELAAGMKTPLQFPSTTDVRK